MTNNEVKILSNIGMVLSNIKNKEFYSEEDYFNIFLAIDGYKKLFKYFNNSKHIEKLLQEKFNEISLYDLIRCVRNRTEHVDKNNGLDKFAILTLKVPKDKIKKIVNLISEELNCIFERNLDKDLYRLFMNTKVIEYIFEISRESLYATESKGEFDEYSRSKLIPIVESFNWSESKIEDFEAYFSKIRDLYHTKEFIDGIVKKYGRNAYDEILEILDNPLSDFDKLMKFLKNLKNVNL